MAGARGCRRATIPAWVCMHNYFVNWRAIWFRFIWKTSKTGTSIPPKANDAFSLFKISPSFLNFSESGKIFPTFPKKCMFHPRRFMMTFFSRWLWISNFPFIFAETLHFPLFREIYYFPYFFNFRLWVRNIYVLLHTLRVFLFHP